MLASSFAASLFAVGSGSDVYSEALQRLSGFIKQQRSAAPRSVNAPITFADARVRFEQALKARHNMRPQSKEYRQRCVKALLRTWPGLDAMKLARISESDCNEWAKGLCEAGSVSGHSKPARAGVKVFL